MDIVMMMIDRSVISHYSQPASSWRFVPSSQMPSIPTAPHRITHSSPFAPLPPPCIQPVPPPFVPSSSTSHHVLVRSSNSPSVRDFCLWTLLGPSSYPASQISHPLPTHPCQQHQLATLASLPEPCHLPAIFLPSALHPIHHALDPSQHLVSSHLCLPIHLDFPSFL